MAFTGMLKVVNPKIKISDDEMKVDYVYSHAVVKRTENELQVNETSNELSIRTKLKPARLGLMLVGWGGNNGSTLTAALIANRLKLHWGHKTGERVANWYGSITQASTVRLGMDEDRRDVYVPMADMLPMVHPNDIVVDGWDISDANLAESMARAQVLDQELQQHLRKHMEHLKPRPAIYNPDFIASNQESRATSVLTGTKLEQFSQVRKDIREFKANHKLDQVIVLWTANTERFCSELPGVHSSAEELKNALANDNKEISPSTIYAMAAIAEKAPYLNGSPQNTFVKGLRDLAEQAGVFIGGDDFKSGQTKLKSVLVDFLVSAGIKPVSIVSYNHLGNNDGKNLSAPQQFRSKEISKSNVVDDMVASNTILYKPGEKPDHCVVIKYVPYVGDSKRAMDEYTSEIMLGGHNTIVVHNTCEDSLLAAPIMLDLVLLTELFGRISFKPKDTAQEYSSFHSVLSPLSYLLKAPLVPDGTPVVNALSRQRACIENILRACLGLAPDSHLQLEHKLPFLMASTTARNGHHHSPPPKKLKNSSVTH